MVKPRLHIPAPPKAELVTIQSFAVTVQTPVRTVRDLIYRRIIPVVKIRRWIRIPRQEALDALQKYKIRGVTV
jgi:hypothetical protein